MFFSIKVKGKTEVTNLKLLKVENQETRLKYVPYTYTAERIK